MMKKKLVAPDENSDDELIDVGSLLDEDLDEDEDDDYDLELAAPSVRKTFGSYKKQSAELWDKYGEMDDEDEEQEEVEEAGEGQKEVYCAAKKGHTNAVSSLITAGCDLNRSSSVGMTPLHVAASRGQAAVVRVLTETPKCDLVRQTSRQGRTALHLAARRGQLESLEIIGDAMIKKGLKSALDQADRKEQRTALEMAAAGGHLDCVRLLVKYGCDVFNITRGRVFSVIHGGGGPLILAATKGHESVVSELLGLLTEEMSRDMTTGTAQGGWRAIHFAAAQGHSGTVQLLLAHPGCDVDAVTKVGALTPVMLAASYGRVEVLECLLAAGCDVEKRSATGASAGFLAAQKGHAEALRLVVAGGGGDVDESCKNETQTTALIAACYNGHLDVVKLLAEQMGCDLNKPMAQGRRATHVAALEQESVEILSFLLERGADPSGAMEDGTTALGVIASTKDCKNAAAKIALLYAHGADLKARFDVARQWTALHAAASYAGTERLQQLLETVQEQKELVNLVDNHGATPLVCCLESTAVTDDVLYTVKVLLKAGCDPLTANNEGQTPLELACLRDRVIVVIDLLKHTDLKSINPQRLTLLHCCALHDAQKVCSYLCKEYDGESLAVGAQTEAEGQTAVSIAASQGHSEILRTLHESLKADLKTPDAKGRSPAFLAALNGHETLHDAILDFDRSIKSERKNLIDHLLLDIEGPESSGAVSKKKKKKKKGAAAALDASSLETTVVAKKRKRKKKKKAAATTVTSRTKPEDEEDEDSDDDEEEEEAGRGGAARCIIEPAPAPTPAPAPPAPAPALTPAQLFCATFFSPPEDDDVAAPGSSSSSTVTVVPAALEEDAAAEEQSLAETQATVVPVPAALEDAAAEARSLAKMQASTELVRQELQLDRAEKERLVNEQRLVLLESQQQLLVEEAQREIQRQQLEEECARLRREAGDAKAAEGAARSAEGVARSAEAAARSAEAVARRGEASSKESEAALRLELVSAKDTIAELETAKFSLDEAYYEDRLKSLDREKALLERERGILAREHELSLKQKVFLKENKAAAAASESEHENTLMLDCVICLSNRREIAFGCNHFCVCEECSGLSSCPVCRAPVTERRKIFGFGA